jgi:hypothetical protein
LAAKRGECEQEESVDVRPTVVTEAVAEEQDETEADASGSDGGRKVSGDVRPTETEPVKSESRQEQVEREADASGSAGGRKVSVDVRPNVVTEAVAEGEFRQEQVEREADASGSAGGRKVSGDVRPTVVTEAVAEGEFRQEQVQYRSLGERGWQMLNEMRQTYARITELNVENGQLHNKFGQLLAKFEMFMKCRSRNVEYR